MRNAILRAASQCILWMRKIIATFIEIIITIVQSFTKGVLLCIAVAFAVTIGFPLSCLCVVLLMVGVWLLPIKISYLPEKILTFSPLSIVFFIPTYLIYILVSLNASLYHLLCAEKYRFDELGIHIITRTRKRSKILQWSEIKEVRQTFSPPFHNVYIVLNSGEQVSIDWADRDQLREALKNHQIEFVELLGINR